MRVSVFAGATTAVLVLGIAGAEVRAITVTVNQGTTYQTIEGLGPMQGANPWRYKSGPFYINVDLDAIHYFDTLIVDGGHTALRADPVTAFQATQGDFGVRGSVRQELIYEQKFVQAAQRAGEPFRILWTCWSPPPWMKANNSCCDTTGTGDPNNYLLTSHYTDFANHWIRLLQIARDTFGVNVYAISLQNEPLFNEPYVSCNYGIGPGCGWNGVCYNNMFKVVAPLIHAAHPNVKLVASEDVGRSTPVVEGALRNDPISNPLVYAWAVHCDFTSSYSFSSDRPVWQTEPHPSGFMNDAQMCMSNLGAGAATWFDWGYTNGDCVNNGTANTDCLKAGTYRSLKMFARYVRPGARRIAASGGASGSYGVIAFYHPTDTCLTIILINGTGTAEPATLSVSGSYQPAELHAWRSTNTEDEVDAGTVAINGTYTMPAGSVTTLVAGTYKGTSTVGAVRRPAQAAPAIPVSGARRLYALDGRFVATASQGRVDLAAGIYCAQALSRSVVHGRALQVEGVTR